MANDPLPGTDVLARAMVAALGNSQDLLADARLLFGAGRVPRAYALAVLALEEFAKAVMCVSALTTPVEASDFWRDWRAHHYKLTGASMGALLLLDQSASGPSLLTQMTQASQRAQQRKLQALYVDIQDGKVITPGAVSEEETRELVGIVEALLGQASRVFEGVMQPAGLVMLQEHGQELRVWLESSLALGDTDLEQHYEACRAFLQAFKEGRLPDVLRKVSEEAAQSS